MTVNCIAAGGQGSEERRERACQSGDARERAVRDCLIRTTGFGSGPRVALAGLGPSGAGRCFRIRFCPVPGVIFHLRFTSCTSPLAWGNLWRARATRDTTTRGRSPGTPRLVRRTVPRFARGRPPRPLSPPTGTRSSLSCRVVLDAQGVRSLILS